MSSTGKIVPFPNPKSASNPDLNFGPTITQDDLEYCKLLEKEAKAAWAAWEEFLGEIRLRHELGLPIEDGTRKIKTSSVPVPNYEVPAHTRTQFTVE